jgi:hypothetical protein
MLTPSIPHPCPLRIEARIGSACIRTSFVIDDRVIDNAPTAHPKRNENQASDRPSRHGFRIAHDESHYVI